MADRAFYLDYQGLKIHCSLYGRGEPAICLHGLNMEGSLFAGGRMRGLLPERTLAALDLPGYGQSAFSNGLGIEDISGIIKKLSARLGAERFEVCGFCLGGIFALDYAIREPQTVKKLYLVETMIYLPFWMNLCFMPFFPVLYRLLNQDPRFLRLAGRLPALSGIDSPSRIRLNGKLWDSQVNSFYLALMKEYQKGDHLRRSQAVSCPTDIITAGRTFGMVEKTRAGLLATIKNSRAIINGQGHFDCGI